MYDFVKTTLNLPYRINLSNLTEVRHTNGAVKHIRRVQQAPYPLTKITEDSETYGLLDATERTTTISIHSPPSNSMNSMTTMNSMNSMKPLPSVPPSKSKKLFPNLGKLMHPAVINECDSIQSAPTTSNPSTQSSSSSSGSSSTKLARQIFNNLNIFSHKQHNHQSHHQDQSHSNSSTASNSNAQQSKQTVHAKHEPHPHLRRAPEIGMQPNTRRLSSKSNSSTASTQNLIGTRRCRASYRSQDDDFYMETDGGSSCYSKSSAGLGDLGSGYGYRRPSVDTISTYLSHGSSASDMRYCSTEATNTGDDDVFLPPMQQQPLQHHQPPPQPSPRSMNGSIVGVDADSDTISRFVHVVQHPEWGSCRPCVICLDELQQNPNNPAVSLIRCEHLMHLNCLNHLIITQSEEQQKQLPEASRKCLTLYIECPVCGIVYGEKFGNQPPGTMTWSIIPKQLAGHEGQNTIQIVYK